MKTEIFSIGFNYILVSGKNLAVFLLEMTLEQTGIFKSPLGTLLMVAIFFQLFGNIFSNLRSKSILLEINFIKEKAISFNRK